MTFSILLKNAKFFKNIINLLTILEEPIIRIDSERLYIRQMDGSHSALVHFELPKDVFMAFYCNKPDAIKVKRLEMLACLKKATDDQCVGLSVNDETPDRLTISLSEKSTKDYDIAIYGLGEDEKEPPLPVLKMKVEKRIKIDASAFADTMDDFGTLLNKFEPRFELKTEGDNLIISARTEKSGLKVTHTLGDDILAIEGIDATSNYNVNYLDEVARGSKELSGVALIEYSNDFPVRLTYELPFAGTLQYFLAPIFKVGEQ